MVINQEYDIDNISDSILRIEINKFYYDSILFILKIIISIQAKFMIMR